MSPHTAQRSEAVFAADDASADDLPLTADPELDPEFIDVDDLCNGGGGPRGVGNFVKSGVLKCKNSGAFII